MVYNLYIQPPWVVYFLGPYVSAVDLPIVLYYVLHRTTLQCLSTYDCAYISILYIIHVQDARLHAYRFTSTVD